MCAMYSHKPSNIAKYGGFTRFCGKMRERTVEFPHPVDWMEEGRPISMHLEYITRSTYCKVIFSFAWLSN